MWDTLQDLGKKGHLCDVFAQMILCTTRVSD